MTPTPETLRAHAIEIAREHAKAKPQSYYTEPFQPHEWVIDAIVHALTAPATVERDGLAEVLALLDKATPMDLDSAEYHDDGLHDCPLCQGEGSVDGSTYTNFDGFAVGVQFFGVGDAHLRNEEAIVAAVNWLRAHGPALLAALPGAGQTREAGR